MSKRARPAAIITIIALLLATILLLVPAQDVKALGGLANVYVNGTIGLNTYDGSVPVHTTGNAGPKQTIAAGITVVATSGTVFVAPGTYPEFALHLGNTMNLVGSGALVTIIDAGLQGRAIEVSSLPDQANTISGFTIKNGASNNDPGGGVYISSSHIVTINDCAIINNTSNSYGGGICNNGGILYMNRCTVSGNTAVSFGGGIFTRAPLSGLMELTNCTISGNTITGAFGFGGGIYCEYSATMHLLNCTIANNRATGANSSGGGFANGSPTTAYFSNCIVASNTASDGINNNGFDAYAGAAVISEGYNIDSENSCYFTQSTDQRNTNPLLGVLQNNGGLTSTHAITASSPAYNRGSNIGAPLTDQRGALRPQITTCDIGAFELERRILVSPGSIAFGTVAAGSASISYTVLITNIGLVNLVVGTISLTGANADQFRITSDTASNQTITPAFSKIVTLTFNPSSAGAKSATLSIPSDDTTNNPATVTLSGNGEQRSGCVATATGTGNACFSLSNGSITGLSAAVSTACGSLAGYSFPHGFFSYSITGITAGSTVTITITLPSNMPVGSKYWKCINGQWVDVTSLLGDDDDGDNILTLTIKDGGLGDADGLANGTIVDPGGPAITVAVEKPKRSYESPQMPEKFLSEPARLSVKYVNVQPQQAQANQPITVYANIANGGDEGGNYTATLKINDTIEEIRTGKVGGHAAVPLQFVVSKDKPGTYSVDINGQQASFIIVGASNSADTSRTIPLIGFFLSAIGVIIVLALLIRKRLSEY